MALRGDLLASLGSAALLLALVSLPLAALGWWSGVELARPAGLALGGLVAPLLALYLLRPRLPRRPVASLLLWQGVAREQQVARPLQRLRRNLPLLLQLQALVLLAAALAGPFFQSGSSGEAVRRALVLDVSASMLAADAAGGSRFEAAREEALALLHAMGPDDEAMVVAAGRAPWVVVPWTRDVSALVRGVEALTPAPLGGDLDQALALAASDPGRGGLEVHIFSDGAGAALRPLGIAASLRYHPSGGGARNVGIVAAQLRPRAGGGGAVAGDAEGLAYEVFASVVQAGAGPREAYLVLEQGERPLAARRLRLPADPERSLAVVLEARLTPGVATLRLLPADGQPPPLDPFPLDDLAWLLVPAEEGIPVGLAVAGGESPAVKRALEAAGGALVEGEPEVLAAAADLRLLVFDRTLPAQLPPRDCLLLDPPGPVGPVTPGPEVAGPLVAGWDRDDPLLAWVDPSEVRIERARPLELGPGARALIQGEDPQTGAPLALVATWEDGGAQRVAVGFDVYRSSWPLRVSFPIFVRNCLLRAVRRDALAGASAAGEPISLPVPADLKAIEIVDPGGTTHTVRAAEGQAVFASGEQLGVYLARIRGREQPFCVNLCAPGETRLAPAATLELSGTPLTAGRVGPPARPLELAPWLAGLALCVLCLEGLVYHRRW